MQGVSQAVQIGVVLVKGAVARRLETDPDADLERKARICFEEALSEGCTWFTASEEEKFRIGVGALLVLTKGEDRARVEKTLLALQTISAAQAGIPVDMSAAIPEDSDECAPLMPWFHEAKGAAA